MVDSAVCDYSGMPYEFQTPWMKTHLYSGTYTGSTFSIKWRHLSIIRTIYRFEVTQKSRFVHVKAHYTPTGIQNLPTLNKWTWQWKPTTIGCIIDCVNRRTPNRYCLASLLSNWRSMSKYPLTQCPRIITLYQMTHQYCLSSPPCLLQALDAKECCVRSMKKNTVVGWELSVLMVGKNR